MPFIDPAQSRAMYESDMKERLYSRVSEDEILKNYVDMIYKREMYYEWLVGIEILVLLFAGFVFCIYPEVASRIGGA